MRTLALLLFLSTSLFATTVVNKVHTNPLELTRPRTEPKPQDVETKVEIKTVSIDKGSEVYLTHRFDEKTQKSTYKVLMTRDGKKDWLTFDDKKLAESYKDKVEKNRAYKIAVFTPPGKKDSWIEVVVE